MYVGKSDYCASGIRHGYSRSEVRLENKSFAARRYLGKTLIQKLFGDHAFAPCFGFFLFGKFTLEPGYEPVASVNFDFRVVSAFVCGDIRREEALRLHVSVDGVLDGGGGAEADGRLFRGGAGEPDGLAAFVGAGGYERETFGYACLGGGLRSDAANGFSRRAQLAELFPRNRKDAVGQVFRCLPAGVLIIIRYMAHDICGGILHLSREAEVHVSGKHHIFVGLFPVFRFVFAYPVAVADFADQFCCRCHACCRKEHLV